LLVAVPVWILQRNLNRLRLPKTAWSPSPAAWDSAALYGMHAMHSVNKLGTACSQTNPEQHFHGPQQSPGSLMVPITPVELPAPGLLSGPGLKS
jgi:hypothetical protein